MTSVMNNLWHFFIHYYSYCHYRSLILIVIYKESYANSSFWLFKNKLKYEIDTLIDILKSDCFIQSIRLNLILRTNVTFSLMCIPLTWIFMLEEREWNALAIFLYYIYPFNRAQNESKKWYVADKKFQLNSCNMITE